MEQAWNALSDPWTEPIMQRAVVEVALLGLVGGALGCWIVFYELSYSAESLAHALLPGLVLATLTGLPLLVGGAAGLLVAALAIGLAERAPGIEAGTAVAVVISSLFGLGARERDDLRAVGLLEHRPGQRLGRRAERDLAPVEAEDAVPAARLLEVVRRDQDAAALASQLVEKAFEQVGARLVDARERLVEEEDRRVLDERAADEHALPLAAGELAELLLRQVAQADALQRRKPERALAAAERAPPRHPRERAHQRDVERGDRVVEPRALRLRDETEPGRNANRAAHHPQLAEECPEERGLAAAVRPEDADPFARVHLEGHVLEHRRPAVARCEVVDGDERAHRQVTFPPLRPRAIASAFACSIPR